MHMTAMQAYAAYLTLECITKLVTPTMQPRDAQHLALTCQANSIAQALAVSGTSLPDDAHLSTILLEL